MIVGLDFDSLLDPSGVMLIFFRDRFVDDLLDGIFLICIRTVSKIAANCIDCDHPCSIFV